MGSDPFVKALAFVLLDGLRLHYCLIVKMWQGGSPAVVLSLHHHLSWRNLVVCSSVEYVLLLCLCFKGVLHSVLLVHLHAVVHHLSYLWLLFGLP